MGGCCSTNVDNLPYQEDWVFHVQFCASEVVGIPLVCLTFSWWLVFWLCFDCITIVFSCVSCIWLKYFSVQVPLPTSSHFPPSPVAFILIAFQLYLSTHTRIWLKHLFANSPASSQLLGQPVPHRLY